MLVYALVLILHRVGYWEFKDYDPNIIYKVMCKYLDRLEYTSTDLVYALYDLDDQFLIYDGEDRAKVNDTTLAIKHNVIDYNLIVEICEELKLKIL